MSGLHTLTVGSAGPRVAFLHGLFGQGRNWSTVAKALSGPAGDQARALLIDLPDHGRSPWSSEFSYAGYADAVAATLQEWAGDEPLTLVGHSLGGKVAMVTALEHPELIERLCVVDIAPKGYGSLDRFSGYIAGMRGLPLAELGSRADAEERFAQVESDPGVRAFLLQNLRRDGAEWRWAANLELIAADAAREGDSRIAGFPAPAAGGKWTPYPGPVLWLVGERSEYVREEDSARMRELFPQTRKIVVKGAAHWVHTDAPQVVISAISALLRQDRA